MMKPCPFCGNTALKQESNLIDFSYYHHYLVCESCCCEGPIGNTPEESVKRWNMHHVIHPKSVSCADFPALTSGGNRPVTWHYQLDALEGDEKPTNSVTIFSRPFLELDESGEHGLEQFSVVYLTRTEIAKILQVLEEDISDMRKYCPDTEFI
jgi:hypothetical protein